MKRVLAISYLLCLTLTALAQQITGHVIDDATGDSIPFASVVYKGHNVAVASDSHGHYTIDRHEGWNLTYSAVGYKSHTIQINSKTKHRLNIKLKPDSKQLQEVKVRSKRNRYSRKDNPAVELMRRVVAAKKVNNLRNNDFFEYYKYEKLTLALNDLKPEQMEHPPFSKAPWLVEQVETSNYTGKLVLPISVDETVSRKVYRKAPQSEKSIIIGQTSKGINDFFQTGDIINTVVKDVFTDVDLYEDRIRLLQRPFISPMSNEGINFYRFYIEDTLMVGNERCIHLNFLPNNMQDMGFRGDLYILDDSTLHIRRAQLTIPKQSNVNFVESMQVTQEFEQLSDGQWVQTIDDMVTELSLFNFAQSVLVTRTTRLSDYTFAPLPEKLFHNRSNQIVEANAEMRDEKFWNRYRQVELTKSESKMSAFINNITNTKGMKYIIFGLKTLFENSLETGDPNYLDICPVNTFLSRNYVDGWRSRLSAKTTANLNSHFFLSGYYAHGWSSKKNYYNIEGTYSLNAKDYLPHEFPRRTLTLQSTYDVCSPSDRFMDVDKDNVFVALKWTKIDKMMLYNRQKLTFEYETNWGLKTTLFGKAEENEACGAMSFRTLNMKPMTPDMQCKTGNGERLRTTELGVSLRYAPGETYINNKLRRRIINLDAPVISISHTMGMKGILGGNYDYHFTEAHLFKRFWLSSWGKMDVHLKGGKQWNQVPYPLLIHPAANQSYIIAPQTFNLIRPMEFINDKYVSLMMSWDMNGKLFNRVPIVKHLHWREYLGIRTMWGSLSNKNNPYLPENAGSTRLMYFPENCYLMTNKPYTEVVVGVHNIFQFFRVEYVRRLSYTNLPNSPRWGIRYVAALSF